MENPQNPINGSTSLNDTDNTLEVTAKLLKQKEHEMKRLKNRNDELAEAIRYIRKSKSWRWTLPIRLTERFLRQIPRQMGRVIIAGCSLVWRAIGSPFPQQVTGLKKWIALRLPFFQSVTADKRELDAIIIGHQIVVIKPDLSDMKEVTIVIPVYNAFAETVRCIDSVLKGTHRSHRMMIVDDASTDQRVVSYLSSIRAQYPERVSVIRNEQNLGFVQSVNTGMRAAPTDDIILLNNDTIVPPTWAERLQEAAYSQPDTASVTPLSNEASIYSVLQDSINGLLERFTVNDIDRHIERHSQMRLPEIPTAVGFCMFLRRDVIDAIGDFDERFGIGYGEENDWCMRATNAGYRHYLHDGCFVYHVGHVSMKEAGHTNGEATIASHEDLLQSIHPEYASRVQHFLQTAIMQSIRSSVEQNIAHCRPAQERILYILHHPIRTERIGGIEYHVTDLSDALQKEYECFTIAPIGQQIIVQSEKTDGVIERLFQYEIIGTSEQDILSTMDRIFRRFAPDIVHVHHTQGLSYGVLPLASKHGASVIYSAHDWLFVNEKTHPICTTNTDVIDPAIAEERRVFLQSADAIVTPSKTVMDIAESMYGDLPAIKRIIPYGMDTKRTTVMPAADQLTVCFLSYVHAPHKGKIIIEKLVPHLLKRNIRVVFLGSESHYWTEIDSDPLVQFAGLYDRTIVAEQLETIAPHLICILSTAPETYCYAHDEAWCAGIPVYTTPIGAPAERIQAYGGGRIAPSFDAEAMAQDIVAFLQSPAYEKTRQDIGDIPIGYVADMADQHRQLYRDVRKKMTPERAKD